MPKRRRPVRPVRRPNFQRAPEAPSNGSDAEVEDQEAAPTFADEPAMTLPAFGAGGPVETRPHWVSRDQRAQGRRMAQLRRSSSEQRGTTRAGATTPLPTFSTGFILGEMRQILITTAAMLALVVVLALVLR
jgi:hypothetical protein